MEKIEETYRPYGTWVRDIADLPRSMGEVLRRELGRPAMTGWKEERADPGTDQEIHRLRRVYARTERHGAPEGRGMASREEEYLLPPS